MECYSENSKQCPFRRKFYIFQGRRERGARGEGGVPVPPPFNGAKTFFPRKIRKHKNFTCEERIKHMSLFLEQDISDKK